MQIQRIQTVWLLIAVICAATSLAFNWLKVGADYVTASTDLTLLVLGLLGALLPLIAIFMYRNLRRQRLVARLSTLFAWAAVAYAVARAYVGPFDGAEVCILAPVLMAVGGVFSCLAVRGINHDERLLRSADRIR